ncbi:Intraflagellar transport complex B protein 46 C terminal [Trypanosoma brucei equiperdum]|uniref:Intraflagellar transport complex B protein 46 C terminal n=1 Tax=Trypanosoma brucei equiperdum TaxID=630700 RepID=A0A3L6L5U0_9TRYP|nr:Intraflagellar transport complex B protein 46 C terminal [Trypanosoma brucei equiperdum]
MPRGSSKSKKEVSEEPKTTGGSGGDATETSPPTPKAKKGKGGDKMLVNEPNDEKHTVEDARTVQTPSDHETSAARKKPPPKDVKDEKKSEPAHGGGRLLKNNPNDEVVPVEGMHNVATPRSGLITTESDGAKGTMLRNAPHDEAIPVSGHAITMDTPKRTIDVHPGTITNTDDDDDPKSTEEEESVPIGRTRGYCNPRPEAINLEAEVPETTAPNLGYKPQEYAMVNANASREVQELFKRILDYQPQTPELPAKLRPFIPDYVPSIGDLDPFCKIPRPDGKPDGLGIYVLDEPSVAQSNPAVVLLELRATNIHSVGGLAEAVDSFEDAANRPEVIDRWINDVKKVHYKKPLPTINYQKPMPEIDLLLQVWPQEFEEFLNSDVQFPPPQIDLDLDQYVRVLCCILDIPTYTSLIDSLHVMFTLYQEFRANQHFQHE